MYNININILNNKIFYLENKNIIMFIYFLKLFNHFIINLFKIIFNFIIWILFLLHIKVKLYK